MSRTINYRTQRSAKLLFGTDPRRLAAAKNRVATFVGTKRPVRTFEEARAAEDAYLQQERERSAQITRDRRLAFLNG